MPDAKIIGGVADVVARPIDEALEVKPVPVSWDANARADSLEKQLPDMRKPAEWAHLRTTQSGEFILWLALPDGEMVKLTTATLKVPLGKVGAISARLAACLTDEPKKPIVEGMEMR